MREADVKSINTLSRKEIIAKPKDKMVLSNALISAPVEYSGRFLSSLKILILFGLSWKF